MDEIDIMGYKGGGGRIIPSHFLICGTTSIWNEFYNIHVDVWETHPAAMREALSMKLRSNVSIHTLNAHPIKYGGTRALLGLSVQKKDISKYISLWHLTGK